MCTSMVAIVGSGSKIHISNGSFCCHGSVRYDGGFDGCGATIKGGDDWVLPCNLVTAVAGY